MKIRNLSKKTQILKKLKHFILDKYTTTRKHGFRVEGASLNKNVAKSTLQKQNIFKTLKQYFENDKDNLALKEFINKLKIFINIVKSDDFQRFYFIGSSLLFIYDKANPNNSKLNLIDFDNSLILDDDKDIQSNFKHTQKTRKIFNNLLIILEDFLQKKQQ
jgi:hypothetical protein